MITQRVDVAPTPLWLPAGFALPIYPMVAALCPGWRVLPDVAFAKGTPLNCKVGIEAVPVLLMSFEFLGLVFLCPSHESV